MPSETRVLQTALGVTVLSGLLQLVAVGSDWWAVLNVPTGWYRPATKTYVSQRWAGLWRICDREWDNRTYPVRSSSRCVSMPLFPSEEEIQKDPELDHQILNYFRTATAFAVISLALLFIAGVFGYYAISELRYMFKRLTAVLHFMAAACIVICNEVFIYSYEYVKKNLPQRYPKTARLSYSWSFHLSWVPLGLTLLAGLVFMICGRKRKGDQASTVDEARANEPVILGRD